MCNAIMCLQLQVLESLKEGLIERFLDFTKQFNLPFTV